MPIKPFIYTLLFIGCMGQAFAQEKSLSVENILDIVRKYHPVIKQSFLQNEMAKNELRASRGIFDPSIQINTDEKTYDNKLYYKYNTSELKIPLWYGIDIKAGTENNIGERIDPTLTRNKSAFVGVSMDPFRGIIVDKRNAVVKQAKNFVDLTKNEQLLVVNDVLLEATSAYWNWVNAYFINTILTKSVQNNKERYEVINPGFANRLMQMAEKEQEHRMNTQLFLINTEKTLQTKDLDNIRRGQIFALVSVVLVLLLCAYIAYAGQAQEAKWVAVSVIVGLAGVFITGRLKNSDKKQK